MIVRLWKGYHSAELFPLVQQSWEDDVLLILCPPLLQDFSFLSVLPEGPLETHGTWTDAEVQALKSVVRAQEWTATEKPVLGVFTSGTLSLSPRLVLYSKRNVQASLDGVYSLFETSRIEHVFCYPQAFHTFGLTLGYLASHLRGWNLHTPEGKYQTAAHAQRADLHHESVLTLGTPTHFYDLLQWVRKTGRELTPSYTCILGGASVSRDLWLEAQRGLKISAPSIGYGCTEAAPGITHLPPGQAPKQDDEIGYPLPSLQTRIRGDGVEISGSSLCLAIIQNGRMTIPQSLLIRDRIEKDSRGVWLYHGRLDLLMNRGGAKYSLEAIEKALREQLGVNTVACGVRDSRLGEDLAIAFQHSANQELLERTQDVLREVFALKLQPDKTRFLTDFPLNECSKLDRKSIWTMFQEERTILG